MAQNTVYAAHMKPVASVMAVRDNANCVGAAVATHRDTPASRAGTMVCQRRSCIRSELRANHSMKMAAAM
ncbi:hypothetical protein D3C87_1671670 [compost metagenome]